MSQQNSLRHGRQTLGYSISYLSSVFHVLGKALLYGTLSGLEVHDDDTKDYPKKDQLWQEAYPSAWRKPVVCFCLSLGRDCRI